MVVKSSVLKELEECYRESGNQLVVLYGRTDSEKERLLGAFVQNKKHFITVQDRWRSGSSARRWGVNWRRGSR